MAIKFMLERGTKRRRPSPQKATKTPKSREKKGRWERQIERWGGATNLKRWACWMIKKVMMPATGF